MRIAEHVREQIQARFGQHNWDQGLQAVESWNGEHGTVAYLVADLPGGRVLVLLANDGLVDAMLSRRSKDVSTDSFGARRVVDMRVYPLV